MEIQFGGVSYTAELQLGDIVAAEKARKLAGVRYTMELQFGGVSYTDELQLGDIVAAEKARNLGGVRYTSEFIESCHRS